MSTLTIQVLDFGALYAGVLGAMSKLINHNETFFSLLKITALFGIVVVSVGYLKQRNPMLYANWIIWYVLIAQVMIIPTMDVTIETLGVKKTHEVRDVPIVFAWMAGLMTHVGIGLAEEYDDLFSSADGSAYTQNGMLKEAQQIQTIIASQVHNPQLINEMNGFIRNCVLGDININHKYAFQTLRQSTNIWSLISQSASPIRMTDIDGVSVTCQEAVDLKTTNSLPHKLQNEMNEIEHEHATDAKQINALLKSYQLLDNQSENGLLQILMMHAVHQGVIYYQTLTDSTASVMIQADNKPYHWVKTGQKIGTVLPIVHTVFTLLLFAIFPLLVLMLIVSNASGLLIKYVHFFVSLQLWPVLFALLNTFMTLYMKHTILSQTSLTLATENTWNIFFDDSLAATGYLMLFIPFIAHKMVNFVTPRSIVTGMGKT